MAINHHWTFNIIILVSVFSPNLLSKLIGEKLKCLYSHVSFAQMFNYSTQVLQKKKKILCCYELEIFWIWANFSNISHYEIMIQHTVRLQNKLFWSIRNTKSSFAKTIFCSVTGIILPKSMTRYTEKKKALVTIVYCRYSTCQC